MQFQNTIKEEITVHGVNVYDGKPNSVTFQPAIEGTGLAFLVDGIRIPAAIETAKHSGFGIAVSAQGKTAYLVEHICSAAYGAGIDNVLMKLSGNVVPTVQTCGKEFVEALLSVRTPQSAPRKLWQYAHAEPWQMHWPNTRIRVEAHNKFTIEDHVSKPYRSVLDQCMTFDFSEEGYQREIMSARSPAPFWWSWAASLFLALGKRGWHGITKDNYLIIPSLKAKEYPYPGNYENPKLEFVRHKILDVIGTLALTGKYFDNTKFVFGCSGHRYDIPAIQAMLREELFTEVTSPQPQTRHPSPVPAGAGDTSHSVPQIIAPMRHSDESSTLS